jgi:hypothetical protein
MSAAQATVIAPIIAAAAIMDLKNIEASLTELHVYCGLQAARGRLSGAARDS